MVRYCIALLALGLSFPAVEATPMRAQAVSPVAVVRQILDAPDARLDYLAAATTFDRLVNKDSNIVATNATVARLVDAARQMAGPNPTDSYKLSAIRKAIYVSGLWNYNRAFSYDLADPLGQRLASRQLSTYVATRKGNCVSMPTLFLIVADRIGLNVHLATAPLHMFIRYTDPAGVVSNLEATSGGHAATDPFYREKMPMTDRAVESGAYMRTLSKRETIAELATTVMDALIDQRRFQDAVDVADAILKVNPRESYVMAKKGTVIAGMMQAEFVDKYPNPALIPATLRPRYMMLARQNERLFKDAEALGWAPSQ